MNIFSGIFIFTPMISFLGVCDPYDSDLCQTQNDWEICTEDVFDCPAIHAPGEYNFYCSDLLFFYNSTLNT